jgi:kynureninase
VYLNTCSLGARSERSRRRLDAYLDDWDTLGARAWYRRWLGELDGLREDFGAVIGVPGDEITLAPNVSVALAVIASALDAVHRGDAATAELLRAAGVDAGPTPRPKVVTTALDFPTIGHQWLARESLGVELVVIPSPDGVSVPLEAFAEAIDERTALVATGHVYFTTGARLDLRPLADLCHAARGPAARRRLPGHRHRPDRRVADGVDLYVSGTLKWLFGGSGTAFAWVRPALHGRWSPPPPAGSAAPASSPSRSTSWSSPLTAAATSSGHRRCRAPRSRAVAWISCARSASVRLGERTGDLGDLLVGLAEAAGLAVRGPRDAASRGGIVPIGVADPKPVVDALADDGIIVDFRPGIVRCSPAFYNTEDEVRLLVERLDRFVPAPDRAVSPG